MPPQRTTWLPRGRALWYWRPAALHAAPRAKQVGGRQDVQGGPARCVPKLLAVLAPDARSGSLSTNQAACPCPHPSPPPGGFLALDWCDGQAVGPLARRSFQLHAELAESLGTDCGYRRVTTHSIAVKQGGAAGRLRVPVGITWCANKPCMPLLL